MSCWLCIYTGSAIAVCACVAEDNVYRRGGPASFVRVRVIVESQSAQGLIEPSLLEDIENGERSGYLC